MALIGAANEMDNSKKAEIIALVQKELKFRAKLPQFFTDVSKFAGKGNASISFPKLGSFTAEERAAGAAFTEQVIASAVDTLLLDKRVGVHWIIDPDEAVESVIHWELETAQRAASAVARKLDVDIIAQLELAGKPIVALGDITRDIILEMREGLLLREAELESEGMIMVAVDQETALLKIDEFKSQDIYGPNGVVRSGQIGSLYGMPVMRHNGLAAQTYYMATRTSLAYGLQLKPKMGSQPAVEFGADAEKHTLNQKYGVKAVQIGEAGVGAAESAHIMKDAN